MRVLTVIRRGNHDKSEGLEGLEMAISRLVDIKVGHI